MTARYKELKAQYEKEQAEGLVYYGDVLEEHHCPKCKEPKIYIVSNGKKLKHCEECREKRNSKRQTPQKKQAKPKRTTPTRTNEQPATELPLIYYLS